MLAQEFRAQQRSEEAAHDRGRDHRQHGRGRHDPVKGLTVTLAHAGHVLGAEVLVEFATALHEVFPSKYLEMLILRDRFRGDHFTSWDGTAGVPVIDWDQFTDPEARRVYEEIHKEMIADPRFLARTRKEAAERIKGSVVDPIANLILGGLQHLPHESRWDRIRGILTELHERLGA